MRLQPDGAQKVHVLVLRVATLADWRNPGQLSLVRERGQFLSQRRGEVIGMPVDVIWVWS